VLLILAALGYLLFIVLGALCLILTVPLLIFAFLAKMLLSFLFSVGCIVLIIVLGTRQKSSFKKNEKHKK
jgi:hypothetical protein